MAKYSVSDKIVFGRCKVNRGLVGITIGRIYEVVERDGVLCFFDDDKDFCYMLGPDTTYKITKIVE